MDPPSSCQLDTFLRWTNFQLRAVQFRSPLPPERRVLSDLSGLSDGVLLSEVCCSLLSLREPLRVHYQPRVSSRKIENIHTCLGLMREHGVRLPSIGTCVVVVVYVCVTASHLRSRGDPERRPVCPDKSPLESRGSLPTLRRR